MVYIGTYSFKNRHSFTDIFQRYSSFSKSHFECVSIDEISLIDMFQKINISRTRQEIKKLNACSMFMVYF